MNGQLFAQPIAPWGWWAGEWDGEWDDENDMGKIIAQPIFPMGMMGWGMGGTWAPHFFGEMFFVDVMKNENKKQVVIQLSDSFILKLKL